ncbi:MAG TPA: hypothetical protein VK255_03745 [Patescibacteria group bacterium]|nr:hypothetical protein [Patescibacteria group bacterium]
MTLTHKWNEQGYRKEYNEVYQDKIHFSGQKAIIYKRDGYKCVLCNISLSEHKKQFIKGLHIHHKDGNHRNNDTANLITLCIVCHGIIHQKKEPIDINEARRLRKKGMTFKAIGQVFGVTRQRIHQLLSQ